VADPFVDPLEADPFAGSVPSAMNVPQIHDGQGEPVEMRMDLEKPGESAN
jgi:hypothetical protein